MSPVRAPCLLLVHWCAPHIYAELGKFSSPSEDGLTVFSPHCRDKNASDTACSEDLRVIYCMASGTSAYYFAYSSLVHPYDHCATRCLFGTPPDDFLHYFLGSQPPLGRDRRSLSTGENIVAYFDYYLCCGPLRVTCAFYYAQHLLHLPSGSLCPRVLQLFSGWICPSP